ncbi:MAG: energy transducer TonB [Pseudomonadota bacterium]|nr:energy transducer TonB [Pseudomonadota bacterium]
MKIILMAALTLISTVALANPFRFYQETPGGWKIAGRAGSDTDAAICVISNSFTAEGQPTTKFALAMTPDEKAFLVLGNSGWSTRNGEEYQDIAVHLDDRGHGGGSAVGYVIDSLHKGFMIPLEGEFLRSFATSTRLQIRQGDVVGDELLLGGSAAALSALKQCIGEVQRAEAAYRRESDQFAHGAKDSHAKPGSTPGFQPPVSPAFTPPEWILRPDAETAVRYYPAQALAQDLSGRVRLSCVVAINGSLDSCEVLSESPAGAGFGEASRLMALREFKMKPQMVDGEPVGGARVSIPITWGAPQPFVLPVITPPEWILRPAAEDAVRYYPAQALAQDLSGRVTLSCVVAVNGSLESCEVRSESPAGAGFGEASRLMALQEFKMKPQTVDGEPVGGARVTFPITWNAPQ